MGHRTGCVRFRLHTPVLRLAGRWSRESQVTSLSARELRCASQGCGADGHGCPLPGKRWTLITESHTVADRGGALGARFRVCGHTGPEPARESGGPGRRLPSERCSAEIPGVRGGQ